MENTLGKLTDHLDRHKEWIIVGDFNMVEAITDRKEASGKFVQGVEKGAWNKLTHMFWLQDSFQHVPSHLRYSWDSKKRHRHDPNVQARAHIAKYVLKCIDRIYSTTSACRKLMVTSTILPSFCLSDHAPIIAKIQSLGLIARPSLYMMNTHQLNDPDLKEKLENLWKGLHEETLLDAINAALIFFKGLYLSRRIARTHGKNKAQERRKKEEAMHAVLAEA